MVNVRRLLRYAAMFLVVMLGLSSGAVSATAPRTFVASNGSDANVCSLAQPCRSFATAVAKTNPAGEVIVLDSAGYGPVTLTQSVTIASPAGVYAGITVTTGSGVVVNGSGIDVTLRGLTINGQGGGVGIVVVSGSLLVDRCEISGFPFTGIQQGAGRMVVRDTLITRGMGNGIDSFGVGATIERVSIVGVGGYGIGVAQGDVAIRDTSVTGTGYEGLLVVGNAPATAVTLDRVTITGCGNGILASSFDASSSAYVDVARSELTRNQGYGIDSFGTAGIALVHVTDSLISLNGSSGLKTSGVGEITASADTIVNNGSYGFDSSNNGIFTMKNNQVRDNLPTNINGTVNPLGFD